MKISAGIRVVTLVLLIVVAILYFIQAEEALIRISMLILLLVSLSYPYFKKKEGKNES